MVGQLQLKLENLLREHVDLRILLVDFLHQLLKLRGWSPDRLSRSGVWCGRKSLPKAVRTRQNNENKNGKSSSEQRLHRTPILASAAPTGKQGELKWRQLAFLSFLLKFFAMPERVQKPFDPAPWGPKQGDEGGPRSPDVSRPDTKDLLKKMRKVDPNQSKRYRQRTGQ